MEIGPNSAFYPVVGIGIAFLFAMAWDKPWIKDGERRDTKWVEVIGISLGLGLIVFTPALFFLGACLG